MVDGTKTVTYYTVPRGWWTTSDSYTLWFFGDGNRDGFVAYKNTVVGAVVNGTTYMYSPYVKYSGFMVNIVRGPLRFITASNAIKGIVLGNKTITGTDYPLTASVLDYTYYESIYSPKIIEAFGSGSRLDPIYYTVSYGKLTTTLPTLSGLYLVGYTTSWITAGGYKVVETFGTFLRNGSTTKNVKVRVTYVPLLGPVIIGYCMPSNLHHSVEGLQVMVDYMKPDVFLKYGNFTVVRAPAVKSRTTFTKAGVGHKYEKYGEILWWSLFIPGVIVLGALAILMYIDRRRTF